MQHNIHKSHICMKHWVNYFLIKHWYGNAFMKFMMCVNILCKYKQYCKYTIYELQNILVYFGDYILHSTHIVYIL